MIILSRNIKKLIFENPADVIIILGSSTRISKIMDLTICGTKKIIDKCDLSVNGIEWNSEKGLIIIPYPETDINNDLMNHERTGEFQLSKSQLDILWPNRYESYNFMTIKNKSYCILFIVKKYKFNGYVHILYLSKNNICIHSEIINGTPTTLHIHPTKPYYESDGIIYKFDIVNKKINKIQFNDKNYKCHGFTTNTMIVEFAPNRISFCDVESHTVIDTIHKGYSDIVTSHYYPEIVLFVNSEQFLITVFLETPEKIKLIGNLHIDKKKTFITEYDEKYFPNCSVVTFTNIIEVDVSIHTYCFDISFKKKCDWILCRLLWIGYLKNKNNDCLLSILPKEIVKEITFYLCEISI